MKYQRRTDDDRIAELNAKIEGIRTRAERRAARANPAVRQATVALKAIEKALEAQPDASLRVALEQAVTIIRPSLGAVLPPGMPQGTTAVPEPLRTRRRRAPTIP